MAMLLGQTVHYRASLLQGRRTTVRVSAYGSKAEYIWCDGLEGKKVRRAEL